MGWFDRESTRAVEDFLDACVAAGDPIVVARFAAARDGNWHPLEQHLDSDNLRTANESLDTFHAAMVKRLVAALAADPDRLVEALVALGAFQATALRRIARRRDDRVLEAALDGVISIDEHGLVTEFNPSAVKIFGHTREQALGRSLAELVIPARMRAAHQSGLARAEKGIFHVIGRRLELTAVRADGAEFPVELSIIATRSGGAQIFTGFLRDLTEAKRAEASVAVWSHALDRALFGVAISDIDTGTIQRVNQTLVEMLRYPHDDLVGRTATELVSPASQPDLPRFEREIGPVGSHSHEVWLRRGDGTDMLAYSSTSIVETQPGSKVRVSTLIDVTERHRLERAMRASTARLEVISSASHEFASATGGVDEVLALVALRLGEILGEGCFTRLLSADGLWLEPSTAFYHPDESVRDSVRDVIGVQRQRVGEGLAGRVAATGAPVMFTTANAAAEVPPPFRKLVEAARITSALAVPLQVGGRQLGVVSLLRDASRPPYSIEDQQLAIDLANRAALAIDNVMLVDTLERRVRERTSELEDANRELETFSYTVSHDLRAPLRAINGFGSALGEYEHLLDEQGKHYLARIRVATERMANLIDDLLALARIGRVKLTLSIVDMSAMAREVIDELREPDTERDVAVEIESGLAARADARMLRIVLQNLLGNAWKFTSKTSAARIWVGRTSEGFFVRDNGAGFDMAYVGKLFAPFQRLHTPADFEGNGIGLATVQRISRRHGGVIEADSAPGQGARFVFKLET
ncbi:hypothetical protein BH11MYX1_BH11MYX1_57760 [soil metagenome]